MTSRRSFLLGVGASLAAGCGQRAASLETARSSRAGGRRVVVIGAGLSGLATAYFLSKHDVDVLVVEAQSRPGGRIRTLRGLARDVYAEAGATHVVGDPDLLALLEELRVPITPRPKPAPPTPLSQVKFVRGERRVAPPDTPDDDEAGFSEEERALGEEGRWKKYFGVASGLDPHALEWPPELAALDRRTAADWLRSEGASPAFVAGTGFAAGDGIEVVSALSFVRELASFEREVKLVGGGRVTGGTDRIPEALAARLGDRVVLSTQVKRIEPRDDGVDLVVTDATGTHRIAAARVVSTVPFTVLRRIEVSRPWSPLKARAIAELPMSSVTRVFLGVERRFWEDRGERAYADTDLPIGAVRDETSLQAASSAILGMYLTGGKARWLGALDPATRLTAALADVEKVHPGATRHYVRGESVAWDNEPFARGAYAWFAPGQLTGLVAAGRAVEGCVHFAGDSLSHRPGFMHGALASAKRVTSEILALRTKARGRRSS